MLLPSLSLPRHGFSNICNPLSDIFIFSLDTRLTCIECEQVDTKYSNLWEKKIIEYVFPRYSASTSQFKYIMKENIAWI